MRDWKGWDLLIDVGHYSGTDGPTHLDPAIQLHVLSGHNHDGQDYATLFKQDNQPYSRMRHSRHLPHEYA